MFLAIICTAFVFLASLERVSFDCLLFSPSDLDSAGMLSLLFECIFACLLGFGALGRASNLQEHPDTGVELGGKELSDHHACILFGAW